MPLIDRLARGVIETLGKDDFRRIMNDTLDHMLRTMTRRERMQFCVDIVDMAVRRLLEGLDAAEKEQLASELLPRLFDRFDVARSADTSQKTTGEMRDQHSPEGG